MNEVLVVCTANICRSPIAEALLADRLRARGESVLVRSAGRLGGGWPPPAEAVAGAAALGLDTSAHRSRPLVEDDLASAGLVIAMAREHVRDVVLVLRSAFPRTFTLKELVRLGERVGPRQHGEQLADWLARAGAGRELPHLLGSDGEDDVDDPIGGPQHAYDETAALLAGLVDRLVDVLWCGDRPDGAAGTEDC